jgi:peptidoglycan DL-endopeptidase CwlO
LRGRFTGVVLAVVGTTVFGLLGAAQPASADPSQPTTAADAKALWQQSERDAEIASEGLNSAVVQKDRAAQALVTAKAARVTADAKATKAEAAARAAGVTVAGFQSQLDQFANASFRGAQFGTVNLLLTADSADDFLDQATAVEAVAADTHHTMVAALDARSAAAKASKDAEAAAADAAAAQQAATAAAAKATSAEQAAQQKKTQLDAAVVTNKALYNKLDAKEKAAIKAAAEAERKRAEAAAAALAQQQAEEAAASAAAESSSSAAAEAAAAAAAQSTSSAAATTTSAAAATSAEPPATTSSATEETTAAALQAGSGGDDKGQIAAQAALTQVGACYAYAGTGDPCFDCSGLTSWAWAQAGISIPHASWEQANYPDVPLDQLQPGDLVTYYSPVSHVAIYVGNGQVVSAATESIGVVLRSVDGAGPDPTGHRVPR